MNNVKSIVDIIGVNEAKATAEFEFRVLERGKRYDWNWNND